MKRPEDALYVPIGEELADGFTPALPGPIVTCMSNIDAREVSWLWPGRIPLGRISLLVGRPGEGKSFLTTDISARVSTGSPWPDGSGNAPLGSVLLITCEDDPHDTIRPRLDAHAADVTKVHLLTGVRLVPDEGEPREICFTLKDVAALETAIVDIPDLKLIVIDPVGSYIGGGTDSDKDNAVRAVLAPVAKLAEKHGAAVLVVMHRRKAGGNSADDLAMGSRAFTGIARAVWHLTHDAQDRNRRLLLSGKNNLARESDGMAFTICGDRPRVVFEKEPVTMRADDYLADENGAPGRPPEQRGRAVKWLKAHLADLGEHPAAEIEEACEEAGFSWSTMKRAATENKVIRQRADFGGGVVWRLPKPAKP